MRVKWNLILMAFLVPVAVLWAMPAEAGCSTVCANGRSSSDLAGCECCCKNGDAVCDVKGGACSEQETLELTASPEEMAAYRDFIHRLQDSRDPELRALAVEAQAIYDAVLFHDPVRHVEATSRYTALRQSLSPKATRALFAAREALRERTGPRE